MATRRLLISGVGVVAWPDSGWPVILEEYAPWRIIHWTQSGEHECITHRYDEWIWVYSGRYDRRSLYQCQIGDEEMVHHALLECHVLCLWRVMWEWASDPLV